MIIYGPKFYIWIVLQLADAFPSLQFFKKTCKQRHKNIASSHKYEKNPKNIN